MRHKGSLTILLVLATLAATARAQDVEEKLYALEVLVFRHAPSPEPAYRWPGEPDVRDAVDLTADEPDPPWIPLQLEDSETDGDQDGPRFGDAASGLQEPFHGPPQPEVLAVDPSSPPSPLRVDDADNPFQLLAPGVYRLSAVRERLQRHPDYTPLVHFAWRQPASAFGDPIPVRVHGGRVLIEPKRSPLLGALVVVEDEGPVEELDGTVALERGRFLHLRVDLALRETDRGFPAQGLGPSPLLKPSDPTQPPAEYLGFRLQERRQVQRESINYFDHRQFGLIAIVTEWVPPEDESTPTSP